MSITIPNYPITWEEFQKIDFQEQKTLYEYFDILANPDTLHIIPELRLSKDKKLYLLKTDTSKSGTAHLDQVLNNLIIKVQREWTKMLLPKSHSDRKLERHVQNLTQEYPSYMMWLLQEMLAAGKQKNIQRVLEMCIDDFGKDELHLQRFFAQDAQNHVKNLSQLCERLQLPKINGELFISYQNWQVNNTIQQIYGKKPSGISYPPSFLSGTITPTDQKKLEKRAKKFQGQLDNLLQKTATPKAYLETLRTALEGAQQIYEGRNQPALQLEIFTKQEGHNRLYIANLRMIRKKIHGILSPACRFSPEEKKPYFEFLQEVDEAIQTAYVKKAARMQPKPIESSPEESSTISTAVRAAAGSMTLSVLRKLSAFTDEPSSSAATMKVLPADRSAHQEVMEIEKEIIAMNQWAAERKATAELINKCRFLNDKVDKLERKYLKANEHPKTDILHKIERLKQQIAICRDVYVRENMQEIRKQLESLHHSQCPPSVVEEVKKALHEKIDSLLKMENLPQLSDTMMTEVARLHEAVDNVRLRKMTVKEIRAQVALLKSSRQSPADLQQSKQALRTIINQMIGESFADQKKTETLCQLQLEIEA